MSELRVLIPPVPRGVYLTTRIVAGLVYEWATLPQPAQALIDGLRAGPDPGCYTVQLVVSDSAAVRRELRAAYKDRRFQEAWAAWAGDEPLDNRAAPLVLGLAVGGAIQACTSERARLAFYSLQRVVSEALGLPAPGPQLEPLDLGGGFIDMGVLVDDQNSEDAQRRRAERGDA